MVTSPRNDDTRRISDVGGGLSLSLIVLKIREKTATTTTTPVLRVESITTFLCSCRLVTLAPALAFVLLLILWLRSRLINP